MKLKALGIATFSFMLLACSDVGFKSVPSQTCVNFNNSKDQKCVLGPSGNDYSVTFRTGQIDILFVNDNSGSMSPEQAKMANAFSGFLNKIANLDYQIAMVTTDIVNDKGNLLTFKANASDVGVKVLKKGVDAHLIESRFQNTIQRQETLDCENSGYDVDACPSNDERGIYAMNLAIEKNESKFLRSGAHLAIIALGDEDQRSGTRYVNGQWEGILKNAPLESKDFPESLLETFTNKFSSKDMSVHSVVIVPSGYSAYDSGCYNAQIKTLPNGNQLRGSYGYFYTKLSDASGNGLDGSGQIVDGSLTSICESTYYDKLNLIGSLAASNAKRHKVKMVCLPDPADINVTSTGGNVTYTIDSANRTLVFDNAPQGVEVTVTYTCPGNV